MTTLARAATVLSLALLLTFGAPHSRAASPDDDALAFRAAMAAYQSRQWQQSYAAFTVLADGGHVQSARVAAQMHRWGPRLYGMRLSATTAQLALWQQLAADQAASAATASASAPSGRVALLPGSGR